MSTNDNQTQNLEILKLQLRIEREKTKQIQMQEKEATKRKRLEEKQATKRIKLKEKEETKRNKIHDEEYTKQLCPDLVLALSKAKNSAPLSNFMSKNESTACSSSSSSDSSDDSDEC
ncbi:unnamed protein product [Rotaria sp. Silwood2]|nr:unnamed protein product [Rotaria sp. Silwood2]CAF3130233.1 unnamed protein product [Rotaria sp. Silwood2]CAF3374017.1 unnamed protein product [Rotaria sp. Silwood2]CAF3427931.1 unnamed protein product [Rotaria sp. Silwood2]CAF4436583.1 unnamed protein product [Rotaria sp. Silwood2]